VEIPGIGWAPLQAGCQQRQGQTGEELLLMLTQEEDVEIHALKKQGWSISAIARHTGRDRKTVRAYLTGEREAGVRVAAEPDPFDRVEPYVRQRLSDDRHVWATVLFDEIAELGYEGLRVGVWVL
jgi:transposase